MLTPHSNINKRNGYVPTLDINCGLNSKRSTIEESSVRPEVPPKLYYMYPFNLDY